jgi:N-acetylneuraminic acid mutarotase
MPRLIVSIVLLFACSSTAAAETLPRLLKITWREGPEYPLGIQDSAFAVVKREIVSAGGFSRHPKDVAKHYPDAFAGEPATGGVASGFTGIAFTINPTDPAATWTRIVNIPGPPRQAAATVTVGDDVYAIGGFNYTEPRAYRDTYRLTHEDKNWTWTKLAAPLPWPVCEAAALSIGEKIYLVGGADMYAAAGSKNADFNSEASRTGEPVGRALLVLDTKDPGAGWKRMADIPGSPRFNTTAEVVGGKIYALGGVHRGTRDGDSTYANVVDSWLYDPSTDHWSALPSMPHGANRSAVAYADRYIILIGGFKYETTRRPNGARETVYSADEKKMKFAQHFEDRVLVFDTKDNRLGITDPLLDPSSTPMVSIDGDVIYTLGGEGGRRLWHPATFQIGKIRPLEKP